MGPWLNWDQEVTLSSVLLHINKRKVPVRAPWAQDVQVLCKRHAHCPATSVPESKANAQPGLKKEPKCAYSRGRACQFAPGLCKGKLCHLGIEKCFFPCLPSSKSCYRTTCITDIFIVFFFPLFIFSLGLAVTNRQQRPCPAYGTWVFGEDPNQCFGIKKTRKHWATWCVSWLPLDFTWPLERLSCSHPECWQLLARVQMMCSRADPCLNLSNTMFTEAFRILCPFVPEITQDYVERFCSPRALVEVTTNSCST